MSRLSPLQRLCLPLLLASGTPALAQEQAIIVTGRGLDAGLGDLIYDQIILGRNQLETPVSPRLEDVLRNVPGFQQFRRSDARSANPTSQGATLRGLGGNASSRALLLLDGVPQNDPFGGWVSWPAFDARRLGIVRVTRGGGSGIHGPGALAGTIELESAEPGDLTGLRAEAFYGSRDSLDLHASHGSKLGGGFLLLSGSWAQGDGFIPVIPAQRGPVDRPSPYRQGSFSARAITPMSATVELQTSLTAFTDRRERGTALSDIATDGADLSLRLVGRGHLPFSALVYGKIRDFSNRFASANEDRTEIRPTLNQYGVPSAGYGARFELRPVTGLTEVRLGVDGQETEGRTQELYQFVGPGFARRRVAGGRTRTLGAFGEVSWENESFMLNAGGRIDRWWIFDGRLRETLLATGELTNAADFADRSGWEATGRAAASWWASSLLSLRAAAYRGWRLPTLNELHRPFRVGSDVTAANAGLSPERLEGAEAGLELRPTRPLVLRVTAFVNRLTGAIANVTLGEGPGVFPGAGFVPAGGQYRQRRNLDAVLSRGIEAGLTFDWDPFSLTAGYSFADAEVRASGPAVLLDGLRPAQVARQSAVASLTWAPAPRTSATLAAHYVGPQFEDDLNEVRLPDALTFNAVAEFPISKALTLIGRAENFTDERVVAAISGAGIVERATPRTLWIGLRLER